MGTNNFKFYMTSKILNFIQKINVWQQSGKFWSEEQWVGTSTIHPKTTKDEIV